MSKPVPHNDNELENFLRDQLEPLEDSPGENLWARIEAAQTPANTRIRLKRTLWKIGAAAAGLALVATALWWHSNSSTLPTPVARETQGRYLGDSLLVETTEISETLSAEAIAARYPKPQRPAWYKHNKVPAQLIRFQADQGIRYKSPESGNSVTIPANALVYADGAPVKGEVELFFREYRSLAEMLAANIPMHYSDERGDFYFNSGGMFEVRTTQNGSDLRMAPGRTFNVQFRPTENLPDATLFRLPDDSNQWSHVAPDDLQRLAQLTAPKPVILSESSVRTNNNGRFSNQCLPRLPEIPDGEDPVRWIQEGLKTGLALAEGKTKVPVWFERNVDRPDNFFLAAHQRGDVRIRFEKDQGERFFPEDMSSTFTELKAFKNLYFKVKVDSAGNLWRPNPQKSASGIFNSRTNWQRIEIIPEGGNSCRVIVGEGLDDVGVPAILTRSHDAKGDESFNAQEVFAEYIRLRDARRADFVNTLRTWRQFMYAAPYFQEPSEYCIRDGEWLAYFEQNLPKMRARYAAQIEAGLATNYEKTRDFRFIWGLRQRDMRFADASVESNQRSNSDNMLLSLDISNFGTYNCDQIFQLNINQFVRADFRTNDGTTISNGLLRIIDRSSRLFFSMPINRNIPNPSGKLIDLIVTTPDNKVYLMAAAESAARKISKESQQTFVLQDVTDRVGTPKAWAELLGI